MKIHIKSPLEKSLKETFDGFTVDLFKALKPPLVDLVVNRFDGCKPGDEVHLQVGLVGLTQKWVSSITDESIGENECYFIDEGKVLPPPLKYWHHRHRIEKTGEKSCIIHDEITYSTKNVVLDRLIYPILYAQFALRTAAYKKYFE